MMVTVVATLCNLLVTHPTLAPERDCTAEEASVEEIVTDSDRTEGLSMFACQMGQAALAQWKEAGPYRSPHWRVARIMCVPGNYEIRGRV
jgi:hypothetical protein